MDLIARRGFHNSNRSFSELKNLSDHLKQLIDALFAAPLPSLEAIEAPVLMPEVRLEGHSLCVHGRYLSFSSRPLTLRLMRSFFDRDDLKVDKATMMRYAYGEGSDWSLRMQQAAESNLNKLISRTRRYMCDGLSAAPWAQRLDWIVFDRKDGLWSLFVVRSQDA